MGTGDWGLGIQDSRYRDCWRFIEISRGKGEIGDWGLLPGHRGWVADACVGKRRYQVTKRWIV